MSGMATTRTISRARVREARRPVVLAARMRTESGWCDITIRNVSSGGFMAQCNSPPRRGYYIEVWCGDVCTVGYVVWSSGLRFGARSQGKIDIPALTAKRVAARPGGERRKGERREASVPPYCPKIRAEEARRWGRAFEFTSIGTMMAAAALLLANVVGENFARPLGAVREKLVQTQKGRG